VFGLCVDLSQMKVSGQGPKRAQALTSF